MKPLTWILLIAAVAAVAVADICLKRAAAPGSMAAALRSPWLYAAAGLYLFQVGFFTYLFVSGTPLLYVGILQTALYAAIVLLAGFFLFKETMSPVQWAGLGLALVGAVLMNIKS